MKSYAVSWCSVGDYGLKYYYDYFIPAGSVPEGYNDVSYVHACYDTDKAVRNFISTLPLVYLKVEELNERTTPNVVRNIYALE